MKTCIALLFSVISLTALAQVKVIHFNAGWNEANDVEWFNKLSDAGRKSINMGGKTYRPAHFRQSLKELSGFEGEIDSAEGREALQEHLEKSVKMAPGSGEVYIVSDNPDDSDAVVICTKRDKNGECLAEVKGHILATDSWRTAGDGGKVDGSFGKAMKTKLQEVRER